MKFTSGKSKTERDTVLDASVTSPMECTKVNSKTGYSTVLGGLCTTTLFTTRANGNSVRNMELVPIITWMGHRKFPNGTKTNKLKSFSARNKILNRSCLNHNAIKNKHNKGLIIDSQRLTTPL